MKDQLSTPLLPSMPDHASSRAGPFRLAMGLFPLDLQDWLGPDERMAVELAGKGRLLRERYQEVFAVLSEGK